MENEKIECAKIFVKLRRHENKKIKNYYNFYVKKDEAEEMYLFIEGMCNTYNLQCDIIGFSQIKKAIKQEELFGKKEIYKAMFNKSYRNIEKHKAEKTEENEL